MSDNIKILRNYLLYFLLMFLVCIVGVSNVFADTYEDIGYLTDNSEVLVEVGYVSSPLTLQKDSTYQLEEVYAMNISISNFTFLGGTTYALEFWTPNKKLDYANAFTVVGNDINNRPVNCATVGINSENKEFLNFKFNCSSNVNYINLRIYNSSNGYIMDSGIFSWKYVYLRKITGGTDTSILESQNAQIIQGQQDIINNQNQNTQEQIESQKVCSSKTLKFSDTIVGQFMQTDGQFGTSNNWGITEYIEVDANSKIIASNPFTNPDICGWFYDSNKNRISYFSSTQSGQITIPNNANYVRFSIRNNDIPQYYIETCKNGNQALNDSITGLNDSLNDDDSSGATSEASEFFSSFTTNTFGLTSIITAPLNLIQSLTSSTCSELHLPLPYLNNKYLDLPCMTSIYQTHFGAFFTMYQTITYGIIAYWVCVRIFNQVKDFKNPEHDEIEVVDL